MASLPSLPRREGRISGIRTGQSLRHERYWNQLRPSGRSDRNQPFMHQSLSCWGMPFPALSIGAANRCSEGKPEGTGSPSSAAEAGRKQHLTETETVEGSSFRKPGGCSSAVAEAKGAQGTVSGDGGGDDEKGAGPGLASLGDLPSLGKKMVSQRGLFQRERCLLKVNITRPAYGGIYIVRNIRRIYSVAPVPRTC